MNHEHRKEIIKVLNYLGYDAVIGSFHDGAWDLVFYKKKPLRRYEIELISPLLKRYPYIFRIRIKTRGRKKRNENH